MLPEVTDYCRLILIRHPQLHESVANVAVGAGHAELSRRGKQRAIEWIELLKETEIDVVLASDQPQSSQPAAAFARDRGLEVGQDERLRDQDMGRWQGRDWEEVLAEDPVEVKQFFEHFGETVPPEGESLVQAVDRILGWWKEVADSAAGKTFAVVTAGSVIAGFAGAMLGMRLSRCMSLSLPHGGVGVIDVFANGVRLSAWSVDSLAR